MTLRHWLVPVLGLVVGGVIGAGSRMVSQAEPGSPAEKELPETASVTGTEEREKVPSWEVDIPAASFDELMAEEAPGQIGRIALWLSEADEAQLEAAWNELLHAGRRAHGLRVLLLYRWVSLDPEAAVAANREAREDHSLLSSVAWKAWASLDPMAAFEAARKADIYRRWTILREIGRVHPDIALDLLEKFPELKSETALRGVARGIAKQDPAAAARFARREGIENTSEGQNLAMTWAKEDPEAALDWFVHDKTWDEGSIWAGAVLRMIASGHPEMVDEWLATVPAGTLRRELVEAQVNRLVRSDLAAAREFVAGLEESKFQRALAAKVGEALAKEDPAASVALLRETVASGDLAWGTDQVFPGGESRSWRPFNEADDWLKALVGEAAPEAMEAVYETRAEGGSGAGPSFASMWRRQEEQAFDAWLLNREAGTLRDAYLQRAMSAEKRQVSPDYAGMLRLAGAIADDRSRASQLRDTIREWEKAAPAAVDAFMASPDVSDPVREAYRSLREGGNQ